MKKIIAIFLLVLFVNVAFGTKANCSNCDGNLNSVSSFFHNAKACDRSSNQPGKNCFSNKAAICKQNNDGSQVLISAPLQINEQQMSISDVEFKINLYNSFPLQNLSRYTPFIRSKSSTERLAFIHLLRI